MFLRNNPDVKRRYNIRFNDGADAIKLYWQKILQIGHKSNRLAENLGVKNAKWDKEDGYFVPRECYNSYFYLVEDETCNLADKFILHGKKLTKYLDGGSALHGNLAEHLTKDQYARIMKFAVKTGCSYFTFNIPNTICNDCGYISKHKLDSCPKCGSKNLDYASRIIGYLKRISRFSEAHQREAAKRFYDGKVNI